MRLLISLFVFVPVIAGAQAGSTELQELLRQLAEAQAKVQTLQTASALPPAATVHVTTSTSAACPAFARTLQKGSEGTDVRRLQEFLVREGYLNATPTGYFGMLTEKALQDFQAKVGIVSSGSPSATGWGVLGPKTRATVSAKCGGASTTPPTTSTTAVPAASCGATPALPNQACFGSWQPTTSGLCQVGWRCAPFATSSALVGPKISGIDGPLLLDAGSSGTWTVHATGALGYSVIWGDEGISSTLSILAGYAPQSFVSSPTFSHTYLTAGVYTPKFSARDAAGNVSLNTLAVRVNPKVSTSSPLELFTTYTGGSCFFGGVGYPDGTETEGYTANDLCVATNGICAQRTAYIPKFKCVQGIWTSLATNPHPGVPSYGSKVGAACPANEATLQVVVEPGSQLCRGLLCATAQNYALTSLRCAYTNWVDWGVFGSGATTTTVCASATPCEYTFGQNGRACAARQNGVCPATPYGNHPQN